MESAIAFMEEKGMRAVIQAQAFDLVLDCMRMHQIHDHVEAESVGFINQTLEIFGRSKTTARSEETRHMIAERRVIRMLLYRHELYGIIAVLADTGEDIPSKLFVCADLLLLGRHPDMTFIN